MVVSGILWMVRWMKVFIEVWKCKKECLFNERFFPWYADGRIADALKLIELMLTY